jgi:hypothetical protein
VNLTNCSPNFSRGTVFVTTDGSSATFVSDTPILDHNVPGSSFQPPVSGFLMMRNGLRYRIDSGVVSWMRDRNGNMLTFGYTAEQAMTITDSLGRVVTVTYNNTDANGLYDQISFRGFGGTLRVIQVRFRNLGGTFPDGATVLRPTESLQPPAQLFPTIPGVTGPAVNPMLATAVILPDEREYRFRYNNLRIRAARGAHPIPPAAESRRTILG